MIAEVITVMNIKLKQGLDLLSKVYKDLNDIEFYDKGFKIIINEFNKNKERIPFAWVYIGLM